MNIGKESELIEFKETTNELGDAIEDISAILNKHGRGIVFFGVKNNGEVVGFDIGESTQRDISRKIYERIRPQIYPSIELIPKQRIIKVSFEGSDKPYSADGRYYLRVSDESREMSPAELSKIIMETNRRVWERQQSEATIEEVDEQTLERYLRLAITCKRLPQMAYDKMSLLKRLKLLSDDGYHLNNAGRILFSIDKPLLLKLAVFATNTKRTFVDISPLKGNLFELIDEAQNYIKKNLRWRAVINSFERQEVPEIPIVAIREIVINSFAHADYLGWSKKEIDIFPDRVSIYNPGGFPDNLSPEDFANRTIASRTRNELICDILYKCGYVETWGTGLAKTFSVCNESSIRCGYEREGDGFWFIFYRNVANVPNNGANVPNNVPNNGANVPNNVPNNVDNVTNNIDDLDDSLTELERIILQAIVEKPTISKYSISETVGRNPRTIQRVLSSLKQKGFIKRVGRTKGGYWEVKN